MIIEYRYRWQKQFRSYRKAISLKEIIDWLERFEEGRLEDYVEVDNIEEIRITFKESPYVIWCQIHRNKNNVFDGAELIINDHPLATIHDVFKNLTIFAKILKEILK